MNKFWCRYIRPAMRSHRPKQTVYCVLPNIRLDNSTAQRTLAGGDGHSAFLAFAFRGSKSPRNQG